MFFNPYIFLLSGNRPDIFVGNHLLTNSQILNNLITIFIVYQN